MANGKGPDGAAVRENGRKARTERVLRAEWDMFRRVNNVGGPASCQSMPATFALMRSAQFSVWTDELLASYEEDLERAAEAGRNLMTEKYGYMMEETDPDYYRRALEPRLPRTSGRAWCLIDEILEQNRRWEAELRERYPHVAAHARAAEGASSGGAASVDVYARGELRTYSERTLSLYRDLVRAAAKAGRNLAVEERSAIARGYGFDSVEGLERALAARG